MACSHALHKRRPRDRPVPSISNRAEMIRLATGPPRPEERVPCTIEGGDRNLLEQECLGVEPLAFDEALPQLPRQLDRVGPAKRADRLDRLPPFAAERP